MTKPVATFLRVIWFVIVLEITVNTLLPAHKVLYFGVTLLLLAIPTDGLLRG